MVTNSNFIYSVKEVFSTLLEGKEGYYIAKYQRGFKWGKYVRIMLDDIKNACNKNSDKDYFLNFISLMENEIKGKKYFELIDGQQRITTLVLFWSYIYNYKDSLDINISATYNGINTNLTDKLLISRQQSDSLIELLDITKPCADTQDNYYLREAINQIIDFLGELKNEHYDLQKYLTYLSNHVKVIINEEKTDVTPAELFGNLNSNKVDLTDTYLVKGLLLSLASRDTDNQEGKRYREIMESRTVMGRLWDEIYYWIDSKPVKYYFFGIDFPSVKSTHPMDVLIIMTANKLKIQIDKEDKDSYPIFNSIFKQIHSYNAASQFLSQLKAYYWFFRRLFDSTNNTIHNLLGLTLYNFSNNQDERLKLLTKLTEKKNDTEILSYIKILQYDILKNIDVSKLTYGSKQDKNIYKILLSISAIGDKLGHLGKFDFYNFLNKKNGWSIEHIFPQNITISKQSKKYIDSWINVIGEDENVNKDYVLKFKAIAKEIYLLEGDTTKKPEMNQKSEEATQLFSKIVVSLNIDTHSIGNLALLGFIDNIKLSNALFEEKKYRFLINASKGSFAPEHTFSVFTKSIIDHESLIFTQNNIWTNVEITQHMEWLISKIETIKLELEK